VIQFFERHFYYLWINDMAVFAGNGSPVGLSPGEKSSTPSISVL